MSSNNEEKILQKIAKEAGSIIMDLRNYRNIVTDKEKNEIVTKADVESNDFIIRNLIKHFPDIPIYSEESYKSNADTRWIIDPLDGTTPWVWGNSGFSISIALERDGIIELGAVYDPVMNEFYYAEKDNGAYRNNIRIHVSKENDLTKMFLVVDWGNKDEKRKEGLNYFVKFFLPDMKARRIIPQFAPALGLCKIAEGRIHGLVCNDTWVEDHSAGALILKEAGGYVSNFYNIYSFNHREPGIIATNNKYIHQNIIKYL